MSCSWWAPSIPPVPGLPGSSFRAEGQQERHSLGPSMLYLQLSVGKHGVMFVFEGWEVRPKLGTSGSGQFAFQFAVALLWG